MRVYLDNCCLSRPFDDQSQLRVRHEADAVQIVLDLVTLGQCNLASSIISYAEASGIADGDRRANVLNLLSKADPPILVDDNVEAESVRIQRYGIHEADALHLAAAEVGKADYFLTCDDDLIRKARAIGLSVKVLNPVQWIEEVIDAQDARGIES